MVSSSSAQAAAAATLRTSGGGESDTTKQSSKVAIATTSSGSERRHLSGKSGKSANALGLANPDDYQWILGNYEADKSTSITLFDGESGGASELPPIEMEGSRLEVNFLAFPGVPPTNALEAKVFFSFLNEATGDRVFARLVRRYSRSGKVINVFTSIKTAFGW